jgi:hypothetical protein
MTSGAPLRAIDVHSHWSTEGGDQQNCRSSRRQHHGYHHHPPHDRDQRRIARAPHRQHRHHLPAAHVHRFHLDAGAEQQISPCRGGDRGERA